MTREEHTQIIQSILGLATPENQANISQHLTRLSEDYESILTENETVRASNETYKANNETLRQVNAELFLKVGHKKTEEHKDEETHEESENSPIDYSTLFNEKGELI